MPVIINEIVFSATVGRPDDRRPEAEKTASERRRERDALIEDAAQEALRLTRRREER